ncbi:M61 family metallopeptidase [Algoriphagus marinus]|uniref:M61 family metallopeptidase n=1 Tax=Algoriphagus marinus TaxID=1925762 RepID=UPI00094BC567|nr:M61 family metallopeptidase [Algoriphagus marinus]
MKINYHFSCDNPASQFIQIKIKLCSVDCDQVTLQMPSWRPGRYQLADYAQYVRFFQIKDGGNKPVAFEKASKNRWQFLAKNGQDYFISYEYYAAKMDAGSCWVDENQIYLNFVNCCMEVLNFPDLNYELSFDLNPKFKIATTLTPKEVNKFSASNFQELADSSFLASENLTRWEYLIDKVQFNCWFNGEIHFSKEEFLGYFKRFTQRQIEDFGEFPESQYHFIFQLLPYPHYHGVEHKKGTIITFGPAESLTDLSQMEELLGVSSHELYHAWNVCRIRPTELLPYDFSKETFTTAGWMLEGITTYMGDLYLLKSGVYPLETYLKHLEKIINRESQNFGWKNYTILESSMDLWLDGYQSGIPDRKVNIYSHGALICLCLDIKLMRRNGCSLADVMRDAWEKFGKRNKGYSQRTFWFIFLEKALNENEFKVFYEEYIVGKEDLLEKVKALIPLLGLELVSDPKINPLASKAGILASNGKITKIHPESAAYKTLMIGDEISFSLSEKSVELEAKRSTGQLIRTTYEFRNQEYFPSYTLKRNEETDLRIKWMN